MKLTSLHRCYNCGRLSTNEGIVEIKNYGDRVKPGDIVPSGQCPMCGELTYLNYLPNEVWLDRMIAANEKINAGSAELKELLEEVDAPVEAFALGGLFSRMHEMLIENVRRTLNLVSVAPEISEPVEDEGDIFGGADLTPPIAIDTEEGDEEGEEWKN